MTELVEYSLVMMVSTLFIAGSAATYGTFSSFEAGLQFRAAFAAVSGLASEAVMNGSSAASVSLPALTIRCQGGGLSVASGSLSETQNLPVACDFSVVVSGGPHVVRFSENSSRLVISVT